MLVFQPEAVRLNACSVQWPQTEYSELTCWNLCSHDQLDLPIPVQVFILIISTWSFILLLFVQPACQPRRRRRTHHHRSGSVRYGATRQQMPKKSEYDALQSVSSRLGVYWQRHCYKCEIFPYASPTNSNNSGADSSRRPTDASSWVRQTVFHTNREEVPAMAVVTII